MRIFLLLLLPLLVLTHLCVAHEGDHSAPGAIPFAPHGGKAVEAAEYEEEEYCEEDHGDHKEEEAEKEDEHDHGHDHDHDEKSHEPSLEYFFEATYSDEKLTIYPLALDEENPKEFILVNASGELKDLRVVVEFPRSKRKANVAMTFVRDEASGDRWHGQIPKDKDIRFFVNIRVNWKGVERSARTHLEKRK